MTDTASPWPDTATELRTQPFPWWTLLVTGLFSVALGLAVLIWPDISLKIMAVLTGIWLLVGGLARIVAAFLPTGRGVAGHIFTGVIGIIVLIAGLACLRNLVTGLLVMAVIFGTTWILSGLALLLSGVTQHGPLRAALVVVGVLTILLGVAFVVLPDLSLTTLVVMTGAGSLVVGICELILAFLIRRLQHSDPDGTRSVQYAG
ncbi:HdeD family acid-resistance protein [Actinoplanes subglobosus]|uniref:HdeD family acid-resistance protein n=1 Tax=Actinoplanes subglobosus TaxID=1547892 RepID=A0ABV8J0F2_9ACTN